MNRSRKVATIMTEHPHAALVRRGYEAFSSGDFDTLRQVLAADAAHHAPGNHPLAGDFKGQDNVLDYYQRLGQETNGTFQVELRNLFVDGRGHVVSVHYATAERQGKKLEENGGIIFRIVGDKVTDLDQCTEDVDKVNEFWS
jgi:ketosteroid isomerase-like protein